MMGIFDKLDKGPVNQPNPMQMLQQLRSDPVSVLKQAGYQIPANMNDPRQMVNYLLQSGQVPQARYQQVMQMAGRMGRK